MLFLIIIIRVYIQLSAKHTNKLQMELFLLYQLNNTKSIDMTKDRQSLLNKIWIAKWFKN